MYGSGSMSRYLQSQVESGLSATFIKGIADSILHQDVLLHL